MPRIVTVLNSRTLHGAAQEFLPKHVVALRDQCAIYAPQAEFECLSDVDVPGVKCIPLKHRYPGWWAKLELFRPDFPGDFLFLDLDSVVVGSLGDILAVRKLTLLRDWYRDGVKLKRGLGGGLCYIPENERSQIWNYWSANPAWNMRLFGRGDQFLFEKFWLNTADEWQVVLPGQVASWKVTCKNGVVPATTRLITFHGIPRPWSTGEFQHLYRDIS